MANSPKQTVLMRREQEQLHSNFVPRQGSLKNCNRTLANAPDHGSVVRRVNE